MSRESFKKIISEAILGWGLRNDDGYNLSMDDSDEIAEYILKQAQAVDQQLLTEWLEREMPAGTVIGDPTWWAPKIIKAIAAAQEGK